MWLTENLKLGQLRSNPVSDQSRTRSWDRLIASLKCTPLSHVRLKIFSCTRNTYLAISLAKLGVGTALKLSPVGRGLWTGRVTNCEYRLKGPYIVLPFLLLLFCILCGVIVNSVLKSRFSIISVSGFRKRKKQRTNMARCSSPENYHSSGRNTELKL